MRIQLLSKPDKELTPLVQLLLNRGMEPQKIPKYLNSTIEEDVVHPAEGFGDSLMKQGAKMLVSHVAAEHQAFIIVDSDVDGFTSSAILINYLHDCFPGWVENHLEWGFHEGKQHGLEDFIDDLENCEYKLIICPDSATNDIECIERLHKINCDVLILDHHISDVPMSDYAVTINSQYDYHNHELSGAGVVWQFCRYLDILNNTNYANEYIDLCALGLQSDMMQIQSIETKTLIFEGFKSKNIKNPFIDGIIQKNDFSFNKADYKPSKKNDLKVSPIGISFFCTPLVNAICRSGTMEEKELIFKSMLKHKAFEIIPSTKRGHKLGETERVLDQALRTCTNVKNRQTRAETAALELFEKKIADAGLLQHKVLLLLVEPGEVDRNVAGLVANKLMSKYQRPCLILTKTKNEETGDIFYIGSGRGYTRTGISSFKKIAENSRGCLWIRGHENAHGCCLDANLIQEFIEDTDSQLASISAEPIYYVDYIFQEDNINGEIILDIADVNDYIGTGFERPLVYIENIQVSEDTINVYKGNTLKINTQSGVPLMKFKASDEEIEELRSGGTLNAVCRANANEWNWQIDPQLIIEDMEFIKKVPKNSIEAWGF